MGLPNISFSKEDIYEHLEFSDKIKTKIIDLKKKVYKNKNTWQYEYLELIEETIDDLLINKLDDLQIIKQKFLAIKDLAKTNCPTKKKKNCKCNVCKNNGILSSFSSKIQSAFGYSHEIMRKYFLDNGIKTCYICNAQYAIVAQKDYFRRSKNNHKRKVYKKSYKYQLQKENRLKFQLDHYLPKSLFPSFSLSLGNLYPICSYCNGKKSNKVLDIKEMHNNISFKLNVNSIKQYYTGKGSFELELSDLTSNIENNKLSNIFDLKGIYDNHLDVIEDLFERKVKYTKSYKSVLAKAFPGIVGTSRAIDDRLILGTYSKADGFYKRPLSKFIHDINDQLNSL